MKSIIHFLTIWMLFICLLSCSRDSGESASLRIGLIPYTEDAHFEANGVPMINAATMAVDEVNANGGISLGNRSVPVELIIEGIASSPQNAVAALRKLTNRDHAAAIVGLNYSVDAIPAGAFAEKARVPFISPMSTNRRTTAHRRYVFRMSFIDEQQGGVMARFAYQDLGSRRAAILFERTDPYSSGIADVFRKTYADLGGEIVSWQPFVQKTGDLERVVLQIKKAAPDVLYLPGFGVDVLRQADAVRAQGLDVRLLGADGWDENEFSRNPLFSDSFMTTHWSAGIDFKGAGRFVDAYRRRFDADPNAVSALTYDAMKMLFTAVRHAGSRDSDAIGAALMAMKQYDGVSGTIDFVDSGDPVKGVVVLHLAGGEAALKKIIYWGE